MLYGEKKNDYVYYPDDNIDDCGELKKVSKCSWVRPIINTNTTCTNNYFIIKSLNISFNAKERKIQGCLSNMYYKLLNKCKYVSCSRYILSKISILEIANTEIILLKNKERNRFMKEIINGGKQNIEEESSQYILENRLLMGVLGY